MLKFLYTLLKNYEFRYIPEDAEYAWVSASVSKKKYVYISLKVKLKDGRSRTKNLKPDEVEDVRIEVLVFRYRKKLEKAMTALKVSPTESVREAAEKTVCEFLRELLSLRKEGTYMTVPDAVELLRKIGFLENEAKQFLLWAEEKGCINLHPAPAVDDNIMLEGIQTERGVLYHISW